MFLIQLKKWIGKEKKIGYSIFTSNIYLKGTIEKNRRSQNFDFLGLKNFLPRQCLGSSNSHSYLWILKFLAAT